MDSILDFEHPLDVARLDQVVRTFYESGGREHEAAKAVLEQFKEHPMAWSKVDAILEAPVGQATKFFGLQCLENAIRFRWKMFGREQSDAIKNYIVGIIIRLSSSYEVMGENKLYLGKLNVILVHILKQEWLVNWRSFIPEIVGSSRTNESLCENNLTILRLLSEDVFDFSSGSMTVARREELRQTFHSEFALIYGLCEFVLESSQRSSLLQATLHTLQVFLHWIPLEYVFQTNMITMLVSRFFPVPALRAVTLSCLSEIATIDVDAAYGPVLARMYVMFIEQLVAQFPDRGQFAALVQSPSDAVGEFVMLLASFLAAFYRRHFALLDSASVAPPVINGHYYLVELSRSKDVEVWKVCLEYWSTLAANLYRETTTSMGASGPLLLGAGGVDALSPATTASAVAAAAAAAAAAGGGPRIPRDLFSPVLSQVRFTIISRMPRPEEVLIVEDENGEIVHEPLKDTDSITLYKSMRETLVFLTHLDSRDTVEVMREKLDSIMQNREWSYHAINTLCWAIGAISGSLTESDERSFIIRVIRDLLQLVDMKHGKDNKAVVASNIMFIVGQYPRFMRSHWRFLKTVVNKLLEFMHETHPGVQDMACDTLLKISRSCASKFVMVHPNEDGPFVEEIIEHLPKNTQRLDPRLKETFYEAVAFMVHEHPEAEARWPLVGLLFASLNQRWRQLMAAVAANVSVLGELETLRFLQEFLRINRRAARALEADYIYQLGTVFSEVLNVYKYYSEEVSRQVRMSGAAALNMAATRLMRSVKKDVLLLMECFIESCPNLEVLRAPVGPLLESVLMDFRAGVAETRDPEVWSLARAVVLRFRDVMADQIAGILGAILEPTLEILVQNFVDHRLMRVNLFDFLRAVNSACFRSFFMISQEQLKLVLDSAVWAMKHPDRDISNTGLLILSEFLANLARSVDDPAQVVYQKYYLTIMDDVFFVMTNGMHKSGFGYQVQVLRQLVHAVVSGSVRVPLWDGAYTDNPKFLHAHLLERIANAFPNVARETIVAIVSRMFETVLDHKQFKDCLRDFLVSIREFSTQGADNSELFAKHEDPS